MRTFLLGLALVSLAWGLVGCGGSPPNGSPAAPSGPQLPGVPTEGPEAPKAKK